jgi:ubiquinone/menaquinone biosynthesis C-methylase UbiE
MSNFWESEGRRYIDFCDRLALRRLLPQRGGKIADVCGGFGRLANEYIDRYTEAYLFDYAPNLLEQAKTAYGGRLHIMQGSVYAMPFKTNEFDTVIMVRAAHHLTDFNAAIGELARVLKSGGCAIIEIANKCNLSRYAECIFEQNGLRVKRTLAVSGLRRHISAKFKCALLLYALEYVLQYTIGYFKWSSSVYYLLVSDIKGEMK